MQVTSVLGDTVTDTIQSTSGGAGMAQFPARAVSPATVESASGPPSSTMAAEGPPSGTLDAEGPPSSSMTAGRRLQL